MHLSSTIVLLLGLVTFDTTESKKCQRPFPPTEFLKQSFLDSGATGGVYKAEMGRETVAVKRFNEPDKDAFNEISKVMAISHKNVVRGLCWVEHKEGGRETVDLAMQFIDGKTVYYFMYSQVDNQQPVDDCPLVREMGLVPLKIDNETIFWVAHGVLRGLSAIHKKGFIHADIKPQNIMIRKKDRRVKIIDLGSMKSSPSKEIMGTTLEYSSPEVLRGKFDEAADFWALAVTLYEMAHPCHRRPYEEEINAFLKSQDQNKEYNLGEFPWSSVVPKGQLDADDTPSLLVLLKMLSLLDPKARLQAGETLAKLDYKKFRKYLKEQAKKMIEKQAAK